MLTTREHALNDTWWAWIWDLNDPPDMRAWHRKNQAGQLATSPETEFERLP
jgi:hypothetical protein